MYNILDGDEIWAEHARNSNCNHVIKMKGLKFVLAVRTYLFFYHNLLYQDNLFYLSINVSISDICWVFYRYFCAVTEYLHAVCHDAKTHEY